MTKIKLNYIGFELDINYSIQPAEPQNGIEFPYFDEMEIFYKGEDFSNLLSPQFTDIEDAILKYNQEILEP